MTTFAELGINAQIVKAVEELGFVNPMPVQEQVIPLMLKEESDIVALAQTGTGKTAAYGLPLLQTIEIRDRFPQVVIVCPTRELCIQISDDLNDFSKYINDLHIVPVYGGASIDTQIRALRSGVHVIVATPGRLIDLIDRGVANLTKVTKLVLDEADEMLNMGFSESIETIFQQLTGRKNTLLFSATMPAQIASIARKYMNNPLEVTVGSKNSGSETIKHVCYVVSSKHKYLALKRLADYYPSIYGIVFCRTRKDTQEIAEKLIEDGYNAEALHGEMSQSQREIVMQKFRMRNLRLLVATDVAARGIDVNDLTHVIHYSLPDEINSYTHRSGRTGRAGKTGLSLSIIHSREKHYIRDIEKRSSIKFEWAQVPNSNDVCEKQLYSLVDKIERVEINEKNVEPLLPLINKRLEWMDKDELIKRIVTIEFSRMMQYYKHAEDLNVKDGGNDDRGGRSGDRRNDRRDDRRDDRRGDRRDDRRGDRRDSEPRNDRNDRSEDKRNKPADFKLVRTETRKPEANGDSFEKEERIEYTEKRKERRNESSEGMVKMYINLGKRDGLYPNVLFDMIREHTDGAKIKIGQIDLDKNFTTFEIQKGDAEFIIDSMKDLALDDRQLIVRLDNEPERDTRKPRKEFNKPEKKFNDFKKTENKSQKNDFVPNFASSSDKSVKKGKKKKKDDWDW